MTLPMPTLDHVVVNVRDRMDEAAECYARLGFTLTPRGRHSLGSINHLAVFGTDYLELIGSPAEGGRADVLGWPLGLNGLVFGTEQPQALADALAASGFACDGPTEFTRPVSLGAETHDARFSTVRLPRETTEAGRLYFCRHFTRDLVWRDEWRRHANAALGVERMVIAAADPARLGGVFRRLFGPQAVAPIAGGERLAIGLAGCDVVTPAELARRYPGVTLPDGRAEAMAALVLRSASLATTEAALTAGGVPFASGPSGGIVVEPAATMGVVLEFTA
jgi:hypothetical protein